ncbi:hypothetical protein [Lactiplantibacillus fabifermentans]|nr:hypothetical protein [Lactiplantibacillus fabifermentans]
MELTIKGTPEEIKSVLQAIGGSKEHENTTNNTKKYIDPTTGKEAI